MFIFFDAKENEPKESALSLCDSVLLARFGARRNSPSYEGTNHNQGSNSLLSFSEPYCDARPRDNGFKKTVSEENCQSTPPLGGLPEAACYAGGDSPFADSLPCGG